VKGGASGDGRSLFLLRHGSTSCNEEGRICGHVEVPLSERGRRQATRAAELLEPCRVDLVLSSPLLRTLETARIVAGARELEPELDGGLTELALGHWSGRARSELAEDPRFLAWLARPHETATPDGERLSDVQARALDAVRRGIAGTPAGGGLLLVSHGGVIRVLVLTLLGMPLSAYQRVRTDPGSVSAFEVTAGGELRLVRGLNLGDDARALRP